MFLRIFSSLAQGKAPPRPKHPSLPPEERVRVIAPGGTYMSWIRYYDLKKGVHTLELKPNKGGAAIEGLVLTDAPGSFEPERGKFN